MFGNGRDKIRGKTEGEEKKDEVLWERKEEYEWKELVVTKKA